ncbi:MAG: helix-turn-helix domain-containing protein [Gemmatimonadota bacterium]
MHTDHPVGHPAPPRPSAAGGLLRGRDQDAVATFLLPLERSRVDAAGEGCYTALHRESIDEVLTDLRSGHVSAVLVSVSRYAAHHASGMARLVREFPRVPAVALLSANEPRTTQSLLALGQQGVRSLIDVRDPKGWRDLRSIVVNERGESIERRAITRLTDDLRDATPDCRRFFESLFLVSPLVCTVRQLARGLGVVPSTFMSRFLRAGLPAPKRYLATARLVRAARLFENPGFSVTHVANHLEYSSPQSFSRHVQTLLQCTAVEFRRRYDGEGMLDQMRHTLILPHVDVLRTFEPLLCTPAWSVLRPPMPARTDGE